MPRPALPALLCLALAACDAVEPTSDEVHEPRSREHPGTRPPAPGDPGIGDTPLEPTPPSRLDPEIERALDVIRKSGLRFLAPEPDDAEGEGDEYTAEQFVSMLETKREWLGYDITKYDVWLREIASDGFLDRVPYRVVLEDGTTSEVRVWLVERMAAAPTVPPK